MDKHSASHIRKPTALRQARNIQDVWYTRDRPLRAIYSRAQRRVVNHGAGQRHANICQVLTMSESIRTAFAFNWNMINDWTPISARTNNLRPRAVYRAAGRAWAGCRCFAPLRIFFPPPTPPVPVFYVVNVPRSFGKRLSMGVFCRI